jgi:5-methyltetrahydropteroyltriglutamate--homocysteine methyltransferase
MKRSTDRILTTHAGSLPRPAGLPELVQARATGAAYDKALLSRALRDGVADVVRQQVASGVDSVNDGEFGKTNFTYYVRERLGGIESRALKPEERTVVGSISARDNQEFPEYFASHDFFGRAIRAGGDAGGLGVGNMAFCVAPLHYSGHEALQLDIENFKAALAGSGAAEGFLPANTPGTIEHWMRNDYYKSEEEFLFAIAEAMRDEYKAIVDAGFILQLDDPDLPDGWQMFPQMSVTEYRKYAMLRVEALNHALRDIPSESVRLHVCWGSFHGPHKHDIPLRDIIDIILAVKADSISIEASNPRHEHEWNVFEDVKLPEGKVLIPGVIGHCSDFIEHPELVAQRLVRYANLVGRQNVIAGSDCGMSRVGHPSICWAKLEAMAEGARIATQQLWPTSVGA